MVTKLPLRTWSKSSGGELHRNGVVRQERLGPRHHRADLQRRIQLDARPAGNVGQFQPVDGPLREAIAARADQRLRIERARGADVPDDGHSFRADEL